MVFVTGGTGFIGSYILKNLIENGHRVRALHRSNNLPFHIPKEILDKVEWVPGDVLDVVALSDALKGVDAVVHSAAVVSFSKGDRSKMYQVNVEGTANVVNAALENNVKRFLHVSSVAALGRTADAEQVTEEKKWLESKNNTHYAKSKYQAEIQAWRGLEEGLQGVIINPSTVLGFGNWNESSCALFKSVYNEFPWYTKGVNGFVGVEDVAEAAVQLLFSSVTERRFILNAENWTFQQLFNSIAENFGKKIPHRHATKPLGEIAWRVEKVKSLLTGKKVILTRETARVAQTKTYFDNSAVANALPAFAFAPLENVIERACKQYLRAIEDGTLSA